MVTKKEFEEYEAIRRSGSFNMFDRRAREATSLNRNQWMDIITNYETYNKEWGND